MVSPSSYMAATNPLPAQPLMHVEAGSGLRVPDHPAAHPPRFLFVVFFTQQTMLSEILRCL